MLYKVAALYRFVALPDCRDLREPLFALASSLDLCGSILLATEGINGTIAGAPAAVDAFLDALSPLFGGRLDGLALRLSAAAVRPFGRLKVRLKREIVTMGDAAVDPARTGTRVDPAAWNALIAAPDVTVIDTRNGFEVAMGSFAGALDPKLSSFGDFPAFARNQLDPRRHRKIAMFCTGGIRCEKAGAHLLAQGFAEVFQLQGGILNYLETVPPAESRWSGGCFVFDGRVALGHGLVPVGPAAVDG